MNTMINDPRSENGHKSGFFPLKLMTILDEGLHSDVICWHPHGRGFMITDKKRFATEVMSQHFQESKYTSFTRRLNRWNFIIQPHGHKKASYYHPSFIKGEIEMCLQMSPQPQNKNTKKKAAVRSKWGKSSLLNIKFKQGVRAVPSDDIGAKSHKDAFLKVPITSVELDTDSRNDRTMPRLDNDIASGTHAAPSSAFEPTSPLSSPLGIHMPKIEPADYEATEEIARVQDKINIARANALALQEEQAMALQRHNQVMLTAQQMMSGPSMEQQVIMQNGGVAKVMVQPCATGLFPQFRPITPNIYAIGSPQSVRVTSQPYMMGSSHQPSTYMGSSGSDFNANQFNMIHPYSQF